MFKHEKQLFHPVAIEKPNPQYAALLQEQLGGGNGELKAAKQDSSKVADLQSQLERATADHSAALKDASAARRPSRGGKDMVPPRKASDAPH